MILKRQVNPPDQFPSLYHLHHSLHMEDLPFWLHLAQGSTGPILELGVGTGRILLPLAEAGYAVTGLDLDLAMLRFCAGRIGQTVHSGIALFQADMSQFCLDLRFGLIFLPCNTLSTLTAEVLDGMFGCVQQHLLPGGIFAASAPNPTLLGRLPKRGEAEIEDIFMHPEDSEPVQVSSSWERDDDFFKITWFYDHLLPDGRVERQEKTVHHHLRPLSYYQEKLNVKGLIMVEQYGDYDLSPYRRASPSLILVARGDK